MKLLDIIMGYACNSHCRYCTATEAMREQNLAPQAIRQHILEHTRTGYQAVRFGGGEPTRRRDLVPLVRLCRQMDYRKITVQSNGYLYQYPEYVAELLAAGVTHFNISVRGHTQALHGDLTTLPETFPMVVEGIRNVLAVVPPEQVFLDVIVTRQTAPVLLELTTFYRELGCRNFNFWHLAREGKVLGSEADLMVSLTDAGKAVSRVLENQDILDLGAVQSYYLPYCVVPDFPEHVWMPEDEEATVVTPGSVFRLEFAQIDLGRKVAACSSCDYESRCFGVRPSYLELYGEGEIMPVTNALKKQEE